MLATLCVSNKLVGNHASTTYYVQVLCKLRSIKTRKMLKVESSPIAHKRKTQIEADLKRNPTDPRYSFCTPSKSKSAVWENFHVVKFNDQVESYAQCKNCKDILSYSTKCGTGSLLRHKCIKRSNSRHTKAISLVEIKNESTQSPTVEQSADIKAKNENDSVLGYDNFDDYEESPVEMTSIINYPNSSTKVKEQHESSHDTEMNDDDPITSAVEPASQINVRDIYDAFGENVANEMRQLRDVEEVQFQLKTAILKSILDANTAAHALRKSRAKKTRKKYKT